MMIRKREQTRSRGHELANRLSFWSPSRSFRSTRTRAMLLSLLYHSWCSIALPNIIPDFLIDSRVAS